MKSKFFLISTIFFLSSLPFAYSNSKITVIRAGHFPNVTHAPALVGQATKRFETALGNSTAIKWNLFNAGPEATEALAAGAVDILYVGPNPAVNGFVRSKGDLLRIISGVASGGSALVVRNGADIEKIENLRGKRVATPQLGNTQDVALRHLLSQNGLKSKAQGGDVDILNLSGADQLTAIHKGQIDAAWTVEPWVSRLVAETGAKIILDEKTLWPDGKYATTVLVVRKKFLDENPDLVETWLREHVAIISWMNTHLDEAKKITNEELKRETGKALPDHYLNECFKRIQFTEDPMQDAVQQSAERAFKVGFLGKNPIDLSALYDHSFLNKIREKKA